MKYFCTTMNLQVHVVDAKHRIQRLLLLHIVIVLVVVIVDVIGMVSQLETVSVIVLKSFSQFRKHILT